ncbi:recombinase family protein [Cedecea sp. P7760]|nr:recombinase family protein [Cedecea sp. P7760]
MLVGYVRVSTNDQNTALQKNALECAGCELILEGKISVKAADRLGLKIDGRMFNPGINIIDSLFQLT